MDKSLFNNAYFLELQIFLIQDFFNWYLFFYYFHKFHLLNINLKPPYQLIKNQQD